MPKLILLITGLGALMTPAAAWSYLYVEKSFQQKMSESDIVLVWNHRRANTGGCGEVQRNRSSPTGCDAERQA